MSLSAWLVAALSILGQLEPTIDALDSVSIVLGGLRLTPLLLIKLGVLLIVALWLTNIASNFIESRITQSGDGAQVGLIGIESGVPPSPGQKMIAVATDAGPESTVEVYDSVTGALRFTVDPFPGFNLGLSVASGDFNGDGFGDIIVGAGAGDPGRVRVFSGLTRFVLADFYVNDPLEPGTSIPSIQSDAGIRVSAADVNGDGILDVITAKGPGTHPTVRIYQLGAVNPVTHALFPVLQEIRHFDAFDGPSSYGLFVGGSA